MGRTQQECGMAVDKPIASSGKLNSCPLDSYFEARVQKAMLLVVPPGCYNKFHTWLSYNPVITSQGSRQWISITNSVRL